MSARRLNINGYIVRSKELTVSGTYNKETGSGKDAAKAHQPRNMEWSFLGIPSLPI